MSEIEVIGAVILALTAIIGFITPILKLNSSITKLNVLLETLTAAQHVTDEKVNDHEDKIHDIQLRQENHEQRIQVLERNSGNNG